MTQRRTQTEDYWGEDFELKQDDIDHLYNILLERETPLSAEEMALVLVRYRVDQEEQKLSEQPERPSDTFHPSESYSVGDEVAYPQFDYLNGKVVESREGDNPDYGDYSVITVELENGETYEFACELDVDDDHPLNLSVEDEADPEIDEALMPPEELFIEYGGYVADTLEERLDEHEDLVRLAGSWFPRSLLAEVNVGHLNLAEAVLDMYDGGPLSTPEIIEQIGMMDEINDRLAEFSMNYGLQEDERFDEVGPSGQVLWYLVRLEPEEVRTPPERLVYEPVGYNSETLTPELKDLVQRIGDEHSNIHYRRGPRPDSVTVTLTYPHRRAGTLPLSPQLRRIFPTAYQAPRIRFTLIDAETGDELPGWVVRPGGYVYGLKGWFDKHDIPTGAYLEIKPIDDEGQVQIGYRGRNPRKEWVPTATVDGYKLRIEEEQREVGCEYDDLMIVDVPEPDAVDNLWRKMRDNQTSLTKIVQDIAFELASLNPQGNVHAKTLYSVVNVIHRSPPGPIFSLLVRDSGFEHVGGPYWQITERESEG